MMQNLPSPFLISYAQNQEDIVIWRALRHLPTGFYVDVGANDPNEDSVTRLLYDHGWRGINVEPSPTYFERLARERTRDINLPVAVGDHDGSITFYECPTRGWSTSDPQVGAHYVAQGQAQVCEVEQRTLDTILLQYGVQEIHLLKVDVEGAEATVLQGLDLARHRPWVIVMEVLDPVAQRLRTDEWEPRLLASGYTCVYFDGLNRFYLASEHVDLAATFASPPNVLDAFRTSRDVGLEQRSQQAEARAQQAEAKAQQAEAKAQQAEARAQQAEARAQQAEARAQQAEAKAQQAEAKAQQAETKAQQAEAHITALFNSASWRITEPLRLLNAARKHPPGSAVLKTVARQMVARTAVQVDRFPGAKRALVRALHRFPALEYRLRNALTTHRSQRYQDTPVVLAELADYEQRLPPRADQVALPLPRGERILYVYVDHTANCTINTGVQRVTRGLAAGLMAQCERVRFVKWHADSQQCLLVNATEREHLARWNGPKLTEEERMLYPAPDQPQIAVAAVSADENHWLVVPEVTHITLHAEPVTLDLLMWARRAGLKCGFVFYDAIPLRRPELAAVVPKHSIYMQQLLLADAVWPISDWAGTDLLTFWAAHEGATPATMPHVETLTLSGESALCARVREPLPGGALILSVGSIEPRKNQVQLIRAFDAYRARHPGSPWRLVLVGNLHPSVAGEVAHATRPGTNIEHLGHVSDEQLDALYRRCAFTVFPSVEEGFGLPILESLWYGKPSVCANFGSMAEVAREGGCLMVDTRDVAALEQGITRLIEDETLRATLCAQALQRPIKGWNDYAGGVAMHVERAGRRADRLGLVYCWIDATLEFSRNTGIQRVTRQLARALLEIGTQVVPVKWDARAGGFGPVPAAELAHFADWNGPAVDAWHAWTPPAQAGAGAWFLMPELPLNRSAHERTSLLNFARAHGLRCAAVFYDAIPWKMRGIIYPLGPAGAHRAYMLDLGEYDLVLPISHFSREDLVDFLGAELPRPQSLDDKVMAAPLAGEFPESTRVTTGPVPHDGPLRVLCVGTVEPRKNHEALLRAFVRAAERTRGGLVLTLAGGSHSIEPALAERVRAFIATHSGITWEEAADDARLRELHLQSDFTVYPSVEEGFGLPILESLWYARPCICADFGAMREVAEGGGCLMMDVRNEAALADALVRMATETSLRDRLMQESLARSFKTWVEYGTEVAMRMAEATPAPAPVAPMLPPTEVTERAADLCLPQLPKLSVCISTYNRAEWLSTSLRNWARMYPQPLPGVELLVCDNTSTDHTPEVVKPYLDRADFSYRRNPKNVGMLGNLRETAHHARGQYVWILGDDDLLLPGAVERVMKAIDSHPGIALVYLNYAYTREEDARKVKDFDAFFAQAQPIVPAEGDRYGPIRTICARNENFFTAIYTLVFRRDHALRAYSQDTGGRPFSSMPTCIPTTTYVLGHMMSETGLWIGAPQLVVNLNVSWMKYAPLWILERIPEVYEVAERRGVSSQDMDRWRVHTLPGVVHYFQEIYRHDPLNNSAYFSPERLVRRFKHLPEFVKVLPVLKNAYARAHAEGHPAARRAPEKVFPQSGVA
jgi:FkbM family methyltransferase